jgi:hypothetical protein
MSKWRVDFPESPVVFCVPTEDAFRGLDDALLRCKEAGYSSATVKFRAVAGEREREYSGP